MVPGEDPEGGFGDTPTPLNFLENGKWLNVIESIEIFRSDANGGAYL